MAYLIHPLIEPLLLAQILLFIFINSLWVTVYLNFRDRKHTANKNIRPPVSVIVPAYNKGSVIRRTIEAVLNLHYPKKEVIVVNDGSQDQTRKVCMEYAKKGKIKLINIKHGGKSAALNVGVRAARYDIILTVDADSVPNEDSLEKLVGHFHDKEVGAVTGTMKSFQTKGTFIIFQFIEYIHMNFQRMCQSFFDAILICPGALTAYRKEAIQKAGMFSNDTLVDDFDMTVTLHKVGYKVVYEKTAKVFTFVPDTLKSLWNQRARWTRGGIQIVKKHSDVLFDKKSRGLAYFSFPMHMAWIVIPIIPFITIMVYTIPNMALVAYEYLSKLFSLNPQVILHIPLLYRFIEQFIVDFFSLNNLTPIVVSGYVSIAIFLGLLFLSFRSVSEMFKPIHIKNLAFIFVYWFLMLFVFMYALVLEVTNRKRKW